MMQNPSPPPPDLLAPGPDPAGEIVVLVVEDDLGYAVLVQELLGDSREPIKVLLARSLDEAKAMAPEGVGCILLDLGLPDAEGLEALEQVLQVAPDAAVVVLTGRAASGLALAAVAAGAQDYLTKDMVDTVSLSRSIRYAVARKRAVESSRRLFVSEVIAAERARLERGLLPSPLLRDPGVVLASRYRPAGTSLLLGGDFFDVVELPDSRLRAVVGDVCGHGPDEAALGVALRIAWRSLVLAGVDENAVLPGVESILQAERGASDLFVTVCDVTISRDRRSLAVRLAGHPPPVIIGPEVRSLEVTSVGVPLGVFDGAAWPATTTSLDPGWAILLYTDGLLETRQTDGKRSSSVEELVQSVVGAAQLGREPAMLADYLIGSAATRNDGPPDDDVALLIMAERPR